MTKIILFDLGGVLAESLNEQLLYQKLQTPLTDAEFLDFWRNSQPMIDAHKGLLSDTDQIQTLLTHCHSPLTVAEFQEMYQTLTVDYYPEVIRLINTLHDHHYRVGLLSNLRHIDYLRHAQQIQALPFDALFLSYEMHAIKPQAAIYQQVIAHYQCAPEDLIFFDDNAQNIAGARQCGIHAYQIPGTNAAQMWQVIKCDLGFDPLS